MVEGGQLSIAHLTNLSQKSFLRLWFTTERVWTCLTRSAEPFAVESQKTVCCQLMRGVTVVYFASEELLTRTIGEVHQKADPIMEEGLHPLASPCNECILSICTSYVICPKERFTQCRVFKGRRIPAFATIKYILCNTTGLVWFVHMCLPRSVFWLCSTLPTSCFRPLQAWHQLLPCASVDGMLRATELSHWAQDLSVEPNDVKDLQVGQVQPGAGWLVNENSPRIPSAFLPGEGHSHPHSISSGCTGHESMNVFVDIGGRDCFWAKPQEWSSFTHCHY